MSGEPAPFRLVFASRNEGKIKELAAILQGLPVEILGLDQIAPGLTIEEDGSTFAHNAVKKALAAARATRLPSCADDSGLEVEALGGEPGVHSARFAGPGACDAERNQMLLQRLRPFPPDRRGARFVCAVALVLPPGPAHVDGSPPGDGRWERWGEFWLWQAEGTVEGRILTEPRGTGGFGYDPVFYLPEEDRTFAELSGTEKNRYSHRGRAFRLMRPVLEELPAAARKEGGEG